MTKLLLNTLFVGVLAAALAACGSSPDAAPASRAAAPIGAGDTAVLAAYRSDVEFLGDPARGGRLPGEPGIAEAEAFIIDRYEELGLEPAFTDDSGQPSYEQPFGVGSEQEITRASVRVTGQEEVFELEPGVDFNVLGYSTNGSAVGLVRFCGYGIVDGPNGYNSFGPDNTDPEGEIVVLTRYEPFNEAGKSVWGDGEWTRFAELDVKLREAANRGVEAIVLVSPRGANDPRADILEDHTTIDGLDLGVPVVMLTPEAMDRIIAAGVPEASNPPKIDRFVQEHHKPVPRPIIVSGVTLEIETAIEEVEIVAVNTGAILRGSGELAEEYVVIGGHHDHVGLGEFGTRTPWARGQVHAGADDNASGTAGVMLAAETLAERYESEPADNRRSVLFMTYSAEEQGLLGARHYMTDPITSPENHAAMLNMDMIGRAIGDRIIIHGVYTGVGFRELVEAEADESPLDEAIPEEITPLFTRSDHYPYYQNEIPVLFAFSDNLHDDYHGVGDTLDKLNYETAARTALLIAEIGYELAVRPEQIAFNEIEVPRRSGGLRVRVGIITSESTNPDAPGIMVDSVRPDTAASRAGLRPGDRLVSWDGDAMDTNEAFIGVLRSAEPDEPVELVIVRDGLEMTIELIPEAR